MRKREAEEKAKKEAAEIKRQRDSVKLLTLDDLIEDKSKEKKVPKDAGKYKEVNQRPDGT